MKDTKLLTYYFLLFLYLIIAFVLETNLRIIVNVLFCLFSCLLYYSHRKDSINTQDIYFILCLNLAMLGFVISKWRFLQIGQTIELINSIVMLVCLLVSIKNKNQYLFLGTKWVLFLGIFLTLLSILYFTNHFLPYISDFNAPLSVILVFILGFLFIITLIRAVNNLSSFPLFLGICLLICSYVVAAFSTFHKGFPLYNVWEDFFAITGISFLTSGIIQNEFSEKTAVFSAENTPQTSFLHFLKKIFY